ncbi:MAG: hypothetical protein FWD17_19365, partial [Polyangiaceae bacterium]|nr:hypothetical protein [Polyangiaceae bacterium]
RLQHVVLEGRRGGADYVEADCIASGPSPAGFLPVARGPALLDEGARSALEARRRDLEDDKQAWGDAVYALLAPELFANTAASSRIPVDGFMSLALTPALAVVASRSEPSRARCVKYLNAQIDLCEATLAVASQSSFPKRYGAKWYGGATQVRAFLRSHRALHAALTGRASQRSPEGGRP